MNTNNEKFYRLTFAGVYPHYLTKVERKGRTKEELNTVITWLSGYDEAGIKQTIEQKLDFEQFFTQAPNINPNAKMITGVICGHRIENIEDPIVQQVRQLDKLVDELAKGRPLEKILRSWRFTNSLEIRVGVFGIPSVFQNFFVS
jgi:hypothetical protein